MKKIIIIFSVLIVAFLLYQKFSPRYKSPVKLYWFIPDGVEANISTENIFQWAKDGKLPNIKKLIENGSYGYSYPNFPSHTPTNFASLLTGAYPDVHGIDDGPMRVIGKPLDKIAVPGFRSTSRKIPAIWKNLEDAGYKVGIIAIPGSTPPEITKGVILRGRWGNWGPDYFAVNFETKGNLAQRIKQGRASRFFYFGPELTQYVDPTASADWQTPPKSFSSPLEIKLTSWGANVFGYIYDSTDDKKINYDHVALSLDKKTVFADLTQGKWSGWQPITLKWQVDTGNVDVASNLKIALIKIDQDGFYRLRLFYNNLNQYNTQPTEASQVLTKNIGPMVDFVDNFPAQLIYYPEDKKIFLDEQTMSFDWHKAIVSEIVKDYSPQIIIHDVYNPTQMLTSRWWRGYIDPKSVWYKKATDQEREKLWTEVQDMYKKLDDIVGEILKVTDQNSYIVFSSDHGQVALDHSVALNNLFAKKGWLSFTIDQKTGEPIIDWKKTKVIYLKMAHVYINPNGLDGNYNRASGPAYEALRDEVIQALKDLKDQNGVSPLSNVVKWENVKADLHLDPDRAGDLVIANTPGYGWTEEMTPDLAVITDPLISGYKQAIMAQDVPEMWTPFIIAGPGIKKNNYLGDNPFSLVDQYPTIMTALKQKIPDFVQGKVLPVFK